MFDCSFMVVRSSFCVVGCLLVLVGWWLLLSLSFVDCWLLVHGSWLFVCYVLVGV